MEKLLLLKNNVMMATNLTGMAALLFALLKQNTSAKENHLFALLVEIWSLNLGSYVMTQIVFQIVNLALPILTEIYRNVNPRQLYTNQLHKACLELERQPKSFHSFKL